MIMNEKSISKIFQMRKLKIINRKLKILRSTYVKKHLVGKLIKGLTE